VLLEYGAPLLREHGALIAWKGREAADAGASAAAAELGLELDRVVPTQPYPTSRHRQLYLYRRVRFIPDTYPRRPGIARKRPLGG
jgi:16S rRNA (guanine527-N7)-methyltransferase